MEYGYKDDPEKWEWEIRYIDKSDAVVTTYIIAYSERQAMYRAKKRLPSDVRIIDAAPYKKIPPKDGQQIEMKF